MLPLSSWMMLCNRRRSVSASRTFCLASSSSCCASCSCSAVVDESDEKDDCDEASSCVKAEYWACRAASWVDCVRVDVVTSESLVCDRVRRRCSASSVAGRRVRSSPSTAQTSPGHAL
jgi:hypothetical protein